MLTTGTTSSGRHGHGRLILAREGFPYLGGSSTLLYLLFETLQAKLPDAECWNIVTPHMWKTARYHYGPHWSNPRGLQNVRTFLLDGAKGRLAIKRALRAKPTAAIVSKSRTSTALLKELDASIPMWHLTSTCSIVKNAVASGRFPSMEHVIRQLRTDRFPPLRSPEEQHAVRRADRILFHTKSVKFWYYTFYPQGREKMEEEIFWDYPLIKRQFHHINARKTPWAARPIDLLFVATDWKRGEKNFPLLKQLCRSFERKKIMVIGFLPERLPRSVIAFNTMSQDDVVQAMVQAKVVVCPSRYDEAPNVLFEAAIAEANIVCSKNCGNYRLAHEALVAQLDRHDFIRKIRIALRSYYPPDTEMFSKHDVSQWIVKQVTQNGA